MLVNVHKLSMLVIINLIIKGRVIIEQIVVKIKVLSTYENINRKLIPLLLFKKGSTFLKTPMAHLMNIIGLGVKDLDHYDRNPHSLQTMAPNG